MSKKKQSEEVPEGYTKIVSDDGSSYLRKNIEGVDNVANISLKDVQVSGIWYPQRKKKSRYAKGKELLTFTTPTKTSYDGAKHSFYELDEVGVTHIPPYGVNQISISLKPFLAGEDLLKGDLVEIRDGKAYKVKS